MAETRIFNLEPLTGKWLLRLKIELNKIQNLLAAHIFDSLELSRWGCTQMFTNLPRVESFVKSRSPGMLHHVGVDGWCVVAQCVSYVSSYAALGHEVEEEQMLEALQ